MPSAIPALGFLQDFGVLFCFLAETPDFQVMGDFSVYSGDRENLSRKSTGEIL